MRIGYSLSSEEFDAGELIRQARLAHDHGFEGLWISDHYHPWHDEQGHSPFVWTTIGALSQVCPLPITTAVTCPTVRVHPAVIAQAAATTGVITGGRFILGVGSGEALNEHIFGGEWPPTSVRLEMLEEAIDVIRKLFTGKEITHRGRHYTVYNARLYTLGETPPPIYVSGFGPKSTRLAGRIGDGYITTSPDPQLLRVFRENGGEGKPMQAGMKVCWAPSQEQGVQTALRLWSNENLPGELAQVLPDPSHFAQAATLVTPDMVRESVPCGPDPQPYVEAIQPFVKAGFDELYIQQIGPDQDQFFTFFRDRVLPELGLQRAAA